MNMSLSQAASAMGALGDIHDGQDVRVTGVCSDSRTVRAGDLFFCLGGESFDGHEFAAAAVDAGAAGIVASRPLPEVMDRASVLMVHDVLAALGALGAAWRSAAKATVVAVTGSAGKTTVKEMLYGMLARVGETGRNYKNHNNQLGVPRCMLGLSGEEKFWVIELGISLPHDMDELAAMVRPDVAVVNNIGPAHLEGLGGIEGVADHKTRLFNYLGEGGKAYACVDYPELWERAAVRAQNLTGFTSHGAEAPYAGEYLGPAGKGKGRFRLDLAGEAVEFEAPFTGAYFAENMIAAAAVAHGLGASAVDVVGGILDAGVPEHRFQVIEAGAWTVVDDAYNANPLSMRRSVENAAEMAGEGGLVLVLGDMLELGEGAARLHRELGERLAAARPMVVFWQGAHAADVAEGLGGAAKLVPIAEPCDLPANLAEMGISGGVALIKGSRSCKMERYVRTFAGDTGECAA